MLTNWTLSDDNLFRVARVGGTLFLLLMGFNVFGNGIIILTTLRSPNLRSPCHVFIAIQAFTDIGTTLGHPLFVYYAYSETFITFKTCFWYMFLPNSCMNCTTFLLLCIGVDRYIGTKYVIWYKSLPRVRYILCILFGCFFYDFLLKVGGYLTTNDGRVLCLVPEGLASKGKDIWVASQIAINVTVIVIYQKIKKNIRNCNGAAKHSDPRRIFASLYLIQACYIFGWATTMVLLGIQMVLTDNMNVMVACESIVGLFANINLAIPFLVYYTRSTLYRVEFRRLFGVIPGRVGYVESAVFTTENT
ncbi:hypothetical protein QR680_015215 [Steinernema hermaphroditum]|uniref:G-protein coupled receptors family 1 profile domain-containing protein n=1 Tax=Steinernema hermaphroditum TaxID=289476 RepID=A0AA39IBK7_9BILA|nr:hypothetical protein QR680_015215 [Steinernema hermaphroditum]